MCLECFANARRHLPESSRRRLLREARERTWLFFESYRRAPLPLWMEKRRLNRRALELLPRVYKPGMSLEELLRLQAWANRVDFGLPWQPRDPFSGAHVVVDPDAVKLLRGAESVSILLDNAGEAVFDVAAALDLASRGYRVALVAKSREYEVDVTAWEARRLLARVSGALGLDAAGVRVLATGGIMPAPAEPRIASLLTREYDAVVTKGIANMEALMERCSMPPRRVIAALAAKCPPFSYELGVTLGAAAVVRGYRCVARGVGGEGPRS